MILYCDWQIELGEEAMDRYEALFQKAADETLIYEGFRPEAEAELSVVSSEEIRRLNHEFRGIDSVTDVLSFPLHQIPPTKEREAFFSSLQEADLDPETGALSLGNIVICYERACDQAKEFGHTLERELAFLTVHSMLHLLGYDHESPAEEEDMFLRQEEILQKMGLFRT